jgi:AcrR family transcriptional regulator
MKPRREHRAEASIRSQRRARLDAGRIVRKAIAIADKGGLDAVSMRALAAKLGVEAMSLYHHVKDKETLIDAMVDEVVGEIVQPRVGEDWRAEMRHRARSAVTVLRRHPWACAPMLARINVGPRMLAYLDRTHGCLLHAGFSHAGADRARHLIDSHIHGFAMQENLFPIDPCDYAARAREFLPMLPADRYPHFRGVAEAVATGAYDGRSSLEFGLDLILDGLARLLREKSPLVRG